MRNDPPEHKLNALQKRALQLGATDSALILTEDIRVEERLASLCSGEHRCPVYGEGAGCPPHVSGPAEFRKLQQKSTYSITIKIELPVDELYSEKRNGPMVLLHRIVAGIEQEARRAGYTGSRGFAAGSCKVLFCGEKPDCAVLRRDEQCPYSDIARPSISGFGIDAVKLMKDSGWNAEIARQSEKSVDETSWIVGVIVIS